MAFANHTPYDGYPCADYPSLWHAYNQLWHESRSQLARIDCLRNANARLTDQVSDIKAAHQIVWEEYNHAYEYRKAESAEVERLKKANAQLIAGLAKVNERGLLSAFHKLEKEKLDAVRLAEGLKSRVKELEKEKLESQAVFKEMILDVEKLEEKAEAEADAEINGIKSQTKELEKGKVKMQSITKWLESYIVEMQKEKFESQLAAMGMKARIEELEREKSEAQKVTESLKLQVDKLQKMTLDLEAEVRMTLDLEAEVKKHKLEMKELQKNNAALVEQLKSEKWDSEDRLDILNQENSDHRVQIHMLEASGLDLEIKNFQSESGVKDSEERYANKKMEVEKKAAEIRELEKKLENLEVEENRLKTANEILSSQIYDQEKTLHSQMEYKDNKIKCLEETIEGLRSQILKIKDCSNAELRDCNNRLEAFEEFLELVVLMLQATLERIKTGKSVEEDNMAADILESLSREETKEQAVAFVEGLQAIEVVFRSKEEKIRELETELLLFNEDWLVVKDQLPN